MDYGATLTIEIERRPRGTWRASTTIGAVTLETIRPNAELARQALVDLYEDTLFALQYVNRGPARALRRDA